MTNPRRPVKLRNLETKVLVLGYEVFQVGRIVIVPALHLMRKTKSYQSAEAMLAGLMVGALEEAREHPSLSREKAVRVAFDHLVENPRYYVGRHRSRERFGTQTTRRMSAMS